MRGVDILARTNPAFGALVLRSLAEGYTESRGSCGIPLHLAFVAVPLVFSPRTGNISPFSGCNKTTGLLNWLAGRPEILLGFGQRAASMGPMIAEWIGFAIHYQLLELREISLVSADDGLVAQPKWPVKTDFRGETLSRGNRVGYWLGGNLPEKTLFATLGVRP